MVYDRYISSIYDLHENIFYRYIFMYLDHISVRYYFFLGQHCNTNADVSATNSNFY